jgi:rubrerythrin
MKETLKNLAKAYLGECQARNRYTFYSKVAQKEGYEQISEIFSLTADQEKTHAKRLFEFINKIKEGNDDMVIETPVPNVYGSTIENIKAAIAGETYETETMYPEFAKVATEEGYTDIANHLKAIAIAEKNHKERYEKLLENLENNTVFKKGTDTWWVCRECGYIHFGPEAPKECPSCNHPQGFYQIRQLEY